MDEYIGIIKLFGGDFAPRGWAFCDGTLLSIAQNTALFSILGTTYGGNGTTTFALPDLRSRVPVHVGGSPAPGLPPVLLGEMAGSPSVTLLYSQMPTHTHQLMVNSQPGTTSSSSSGVMAVGNFTDTASGNTTNVNNFAATPDGLASPLAISNAGGSQPVSILQPFLGLNFIICLEGIYPSRS